MTSDTRDTHDGSADVAGHNAHPRTSERADGPSARKCLVSANELAELSSEPLEALGRATSVRERASERASMSAAQDAQAAPVRLKRLEEMLAEGTAPGCLSLETLLDLLLCVSSECANCPLKREKHVTDFLDWGKKEPDRTEPNRTESPHSPAWPGSRTRDVGRGTWGAAGWVARLFGKAFTRFLKDAFEGHNKLVGLIPSKINSKPKLDFG